MGATVGRETDTLTLFAALSEAPYSYDFYQTLRRLECLFDPKPRWGHARRPVDEAVRFGQEPDLTFAPAPLASFQPGRDGRPPQLQVRLFGLLGPNGPLPLHITEYARERLRNAGDPTLSRFLDVLHHRFVTLFYRAWAQGQPHVNRDRPKEDRFAAYIGSFVGLSPASLRWPSPAGCGAGGGVRAWRSPCWPDRCSRPARRPGGPAARWSASACSRAGEPLRPPRK